MLSAVGHKLFLYLKSSCQQHEEQQQQSPQIDSSLSTEQSVTNWIINTLFVFFLHIVADVVFHFPEKKAKYPRVA